jgi:hypothetical protein
LRLPPPAFSGVTTFYDVVVSGEHAVGSRYEQDALWDSSHGFCHQP